MSIEVKNITKYYGEQKALDAISFSIKKGEIVGFLGPNGAGKSTLMKILTTYIPASEGTALVNSFDVNKAANDVKKSVGYLPEHNPLYLEMYVREYLQFNASIYKIDTSEVEKVISLTGLTSEAHKRIGQLSKGYRQRVGLANALLHNPDVLILDEPTTGLDPNQIVEIRNLIKTSGAKKTIFLSTHIMQEVEAICDRVIIIDKGILVADKKLSELQNEEEQIIEVEFDASVNINDLLQIENILKVENSAGYIYQIYCNKDTDMRAVVFDFAHNNSLKILQLNRKNKNLEVLFKELTNPEK